MNVSVRVMGCVYVYALVCMCLCVCMRVCMCPYKEWLLIFA